MDRMKIYIKKIEDIVFSNIDNMKKINSEQTITKRTNPNGLTHIKIQLSFTNRRLSFLHISYQNNVNHQFRVIY